MRRCLNRDVKMQLQSIGDARVALQEYLDDPEGEAPQVNARAPWLWWLVAGMLALVAGAGWYQAMRPAALRSRPLMRLNVEIAPDMPLTRSRDSVERNLKGGFPQLLSPFL
jgi:hypothetical protein